MKRTIQYKIGILEDGLTVKQFLKRKHYSGQNLVQLKKNTNRNPDKQYAGLCNSPLEGRGYPHSEYMGKKRCLKKSLPVPLPLHIVYEDEGSYGFLIKRRICLSTLP